MARIPRCCGSGVGRRLQLRLDPQPGNLHMLQQRPKEIAKRQKKKKKRIQHCRELQCRSQTRLGSSAAMALVQDCGYSSDQTPSLGTSVCRRSGPRNDKKKKKKKEIMASKKKFIIEINSYTLGNQVWSDVTLLGNLDRFNGICLPVFFLGRPLS